MGTLSDEDRRRTERVHRRLNPNPRSSRPTVERPWLWVKRPRLWVGIGVTFGWPWLYGGYANTKGAFLRTVQHCREELRREHMMGLYRRLRTSLTADVKASTEIQAAAPTNKNAPIASQANPASAHKLEVSQSHALLMRRSMYLGISPAPIRPADVQNMILICKTSTLFLEAALLR